MKILLASIAKNEGAYLPQWISHHLSYGIDEVWILGNSISDNTREVSEKIAIEYPVKYFNIDDIREPSYSYLDHCIVPEFLKRNRLQARAFSKIYKEATAAGFTHVLFFDVDEYFISSKFSNIKSFIEEYDYDLINIKWFNVAGSKNEFDTSISPKINGNKSKNCKNIVRTGIPNIKFKSTHQFVIPSPYQRFMIGYGEVVSPYKGKDDNTWSDLACVMHNKYRSKREYLALLNRGDTFDNADNGLKLNRDGWKGSASDYFLISRDLCDVINKNLDLLINKTQIFKEIESSRKFVISQHDLVLDKIKKHFILSKQIKSVIKGTDIAV